MTQYYDDAREDDPTVHFNPSTIFYKNNYGSIKEYTVFLFWFCSFTIEVNNSLVTLASFFDAQVMSDDLLVQYIIICSMPAVPYSYIVHLRNN